MSAWLAVILAWVGGVVDAVGYLTLTGLFTAHMSGNSAALGAYFGQGNMGEALHRLLPIPLFVCGVLLGETLIEMALRRRVRAAFSVALGVEALSLLGFRLYGAGNFTDGAQHVRTGWQFGLLVALLAIPMGIQTAALQRVGGSTVHTTFITGMLTSFAREAVAFLFALRDHPRRASAGAGAGVIPAYPSAFRMVLAAGVWGAFIAGAVAGGYTVSRWGLNAVGLPLAALVVMIAYDVRRPIY